MSCNPEDQQPQGRPSICLKDDWSTGYNPYDNSDRVFRYPAHRSGANPDHVDPNHSGIEILQPKVLETTLSSSSSSSSAANVAGDNTAGTSSGFGHQLVPSNKDDRHDAEILPDVDAEQHYGAAPARDYRAFPKVPLLTDDLPDKGASLGFFTNGTKNVDPMDVDEQEDDDFVPSSICAVAFSPVDDVSMMGAGRGQLIVEEAPAQQLALLPAAGVFPPAGASNKHVNDQSQFFDALEMNTFNEEAAAEEVRTEHFLAKTADNFTVPVRETPSYHCSGSGNENTGHEQDGLDDLQEKATLQDTGSTSRKRNLGKRSGVSGYSQEGAVPDLLAGAEVQVQPPETSSSSKRDENFIGFLSTKSDGRERLNLNRDYEDQNPASEEKIGKQAKVPKLEKGSSGINSAKRSNKAPKAKVKPTASVPKAKAMKTEAAAGAATAASSSSFSGGVPEAKKKNENEKKSKAAEAVPPSSTGKKNNESALAGAKSKATPPPVKKTANREKKENPPKTLPAVGPKQKANSTQSKGVSTSSSSSCNRDEINKGGTTSNSIQPPTGAAAAGPSKSDHQSDEDDRLAQKIADQIVQEVYGCKPAKGAAAKEAPPANDTAASSSSAPPRVYHAGQKLFGRREEWEQREWANCVFVGTEGRPPLPEDTGMILVRWECDNATEFLAAENVTIRHKATKLWGYCQEEKEWKKCVHLGLVVGEDGEERVRVRWSHSKEVSELSADYVKPRKEEKEPA
ncbi:unnamed protein product [Amoebophrya sp. A120]|nr:unnamed protein product [Amoebophrya sp. A120]|eukprot:GSA120T00024372001.1